MPFLDFMTAPVRDTIRSIRSAPDRWAHAGRRRAARMAARVLAPFDALVFLCHGNVCRSPFAAAVATSKLGPRRADVSITSAGFIGPGRGAPAEALASALRCGVDLRTHRSRLVESLQFGARPLVLVMHAGQRQALLAARPALVNRVLVLGDFDPEPIREREIADPWGGAPSEFDASYARISRCVGALMRIALR